MEIIVKQEGKTVVIELAGGIDEQGAEKLKESFASMSVRDVEGVTIQFNKVTYIGSSGIGKLLLFYKNLGVQHIPLRVTGVPGHIHELFLELKLDTIFQVEKL